MNIRTLFSVISLSALAVGTIGSASATTLLFNNFDDVSGLQLNGSTATIHGCPTCGTVSNGAQNVLRLTNGLSQGGSAFSSTSVSLAANASFSTAFQFQITDPQGASDSDGQGADGLVFVVQTNSNTSGGIGGGIGYSGLTRSVGIEFDTWNNGSIDGNNGNHVGIDLNGDINSVQRSNIANRMNNGAVWWAWVDYDGMTDMLEVRLSETSMRPGSALMTQMVDLPSILVTTDAFVGFTSGTGAAAGDHDILAWEFRDTFNPVDVQVPEPGTLALFGLGLAGLGFARRRKAA